MSSTIQDCSVPNAKQVHNKTAGEETKEQFQKDLEELDIKIAKLKEEILGYESNEEVFFMNLEPVDLIRPRPFWSTNDDTAKKYRFKLFTGVPLTRCEFIDGSEEHKGTFSGDEPSFLEKGEIFYTPAWGDHSDNVRTVIKLFVKAKDLPENRFKKTTAQSSLKASIQSRQLRESLIADLH
ncbi:MAG: hypothetical protein AAGG81_00115 [Chlamydiota bacterium]